MNISKKLSVLHSFALFISACALACLLSYAVGIQNHYALTFLFLIIATVLSFCLPVKFSTFSSHCSANKLILSGVLCFLFANSFYRNTTVNRELQNLFFSYYLPLNKTMMLLSIMGGCVSVYYVLFAFCAACEHLKLKEEFFAVKARFQQKKYLSFTALGLLLVYLLSVSSTIRANIQYIDDMERTITGTPAYEFSSRHLSNFLSRLLYTETHLTDITPLSTILAVILLTVASMTVIVLLTRKQKITIWHVIAVLPLGISPYFMECLLYKYDAPYMALSLLSNVLPLLFFEANPLLYAFSVFAGILISCTTYQAALGIFPILVILLVFQEWQNGTCIKKLVPTVAVSVVSYLIAVVFFKIFLMTPLDTYINSDLFPMSQMIPGVISNLGAYFSQVIADFDIKWLFCMAVILLSFIILSVVYTKQNRLMAAFVSVVTVTVVLCFSFGLYIAFQLPLFACRGMFGFSVCIAALAVICTDYDRSQPVNFSCLYLAWCFFVFSFTLGNALAEQQRYVDFRTEMVLADLNHTSAFQSEEPINLQITGSVGKSPVVERMTLENPLLSRLVCTTFAGETWYWDTFYFYRFYDIPPFQEVTDLTKQNLPLLFDGRYHTIYGDEHNLLIILNAFD